MTLHFVMHPLQNQLLCNSINFVLQVIRVCCFLTSPHQQIAEDDDLVGASAFLLLIEKAV
jgi:hypothetical protein